MQPTIVTLLSPLIFREKLTVRKSICAIVAVVGILHRNGGKATRTMHMLLGHFLLAAGKVARDVVARVGMLVLVRLLLTTDERARLCVAAVVVHMQLALGQSAD